MYPIAVSSKDLRPPLTRVRDLLSAWPHDACSHFEPKLQREEAWHGQSFDEPRQVERDFPGVIQGHAVVPGFTAGTIELHPGYCLFAKHFDPISEIEHVRARLLENRGDKASEAQKSGGNRRIGEGVALSILSWTATIGGRVLSVYRRVFSCMAATNLSVVNIVLFVVAVCDSRWLMLRGKPCVSDNKLSILFAPQ